MLVWYKKSKNGKPDSGLQIFRGSLPVSLVWFSDLRRYEINSEKVEKAVAKAMTQPLMEQKKS